jgi:hypothetical protein
MEPQLYDELTDILATVAHPYNVASVLTPWEIKFCKDIGDRHQKYGMDIHVTEKQWRILRKLKESCDEAD